jgi:hypothetical protein
MAFLSQSHQKPEKIIWVTNVLQVSQRVDGNAERRIQTPETVDARSAGY